MKTVLVSILLALLSIHCAIQAHKIVDDLTCIYYHLIDIHAHNAQQAKSLEYLRKGNYRP
jgi:hypothetical protein